MNQEIDEKNGGKSTQSHQEHRWFFVRLVSSGDNSVIPDDGFDRIHGLTEKGIAGLIGQRIGTPGSSMAGHSRRA